MWKFASSFLSPQPLPFYMPLIFFFFFFSPQPELAKEKAGLQSAERLGKIYMRNNPFANHPPTEFPLVSGACWSARRGTVPGRKTALRGGKRRFQGWPGPGRTYVKRKGTGGGKQGLQIRQGSPTAPHGPPGSTVTARARNAYTGRADTQTHGYGV